uniref:Replication-associated protein n=1 Tax=Po-Circo-like virus TaxID=1454552 RepID=A0A7G3S280_9VIRU|nr:replicase [Po-Circo-like virus]
MQRVRAIRWCFTINNFTYEEEEAVRNLELNPEVDAVIAEEEHLDEGTPHIQGYLRLKTKKDMTVIQRWLGGRAHLEVAMGSEMDNIKYCTKEDQVIVEKLNEKLTKKLKCKDKDEEARELIADMRSLNESEFEAKYPKFYMYHQALYRQFRHEALVKQQETWDGELKQKNLWIWGPPGKGKSRAARIGLRPYEIFSKAYNKWWNGFVQEDTKRVVIDDWPSLEAGGNMLVQHLKIWADRYPFTAETKGGHLAVEPSYQFIITSNFSIDQCFGNPEDQEAIHRRFTEIHWTNMPGTLDPFTALTLYPQMDE